MEYLVYPNSNFTLNACECFQGAEYTPGCVTYKETCLSKGCKLQCNTLTAGNCIPGSIGMASSLVQS